MIDRVMVQAASLENIKYALLRVRLFSSFLSGLQIFHVHYQLDSAQFKHETLILQHSHCGGNLTQYNYGHTGGKKFLRSNFLTHGEGTPFEALNGGRVARQGMITGILICLKVCCLCICLK